MENIPITPKDIISFLRRRMKLILIPIGVMAVASLAAALLLPRKYESTTTILVRTDRSLRPLAAYEYGSQDAASWDQARNLQQIISSRTFLLAVLDSLGFSTSSMSEGDLVVQMSELRSSLSVDQRSPDYFTIIFSHSDPALAQRGADLTGQLFIAMKTDLENRQNTLQVEFLESQFQKYRKAFEESAQKLLRTVQVKADAPIGDRLIYSQIDESNRSILTGQARAVMLAETSERLGKLLNEIGTNQNMLAVEEIEKEVLAFINEDLPLGEDLRLAMKEYDALSRRYTPSHPDMMHLGSRILEILDRMDSLINSEINRLKTEESASVDRRSELITMLRQSGEGKTPQERAIESDYELNREMYNDIRMKLEQARLAAEVSNRAANQYIVLDPASLPLIPSKPNRKMILLGGMALGVFLGLLLGLLVELFDTTLRTPSQVAVYNKPVIALLPDASHSRSKS